MSYRLTQERLAQIRDEAKPGRGIVYDQGVWKETVRELLAELDALTHERDEWQQKYVATR